MKLTNTLRDAFVRQAMDDVPSIDYSEQIRGEAMKLAVAALPPKVRAIWNDKDLRGYILTQWGSVADVSVTVPALRRDDVNKLFPGLAAIAALGKSQRLSREELRRKLRSVADSVTTSKALAELLPEFAKYLPDSKAAANRSVPVIANVVTDFVAAGWPKGKKRAKAAA